VQRLAWLVLVTLFSACGGSDVQPAAPSPTASPAPSADKELSPEETVQKLVSAYLGKRFGEYYSLIATIDKEAKSLEELQAEFAPGSPDLVTDYVFQFTSFRIDSSFVEGDTALVYVTAKSPILERVVREAAVVERSLGADADLTTKMSLLNERLRLSGGGRVENPTLYFLVREPKGWRAVVGWADEKAFFEQMQADSAQAGGT
jgi:hypothetical protein